MVKRPLMLHPGGPIRLAAAGFLLAAGVVSGACASGAGRAARADDMGGAQVQTAVLQNASGAARGMNMVSVTDVNKTLISSPPDQTFQALSAAYATLNIPITDINQQARTLGNAAYRVRRRIGDVPTMRAVDCGGDSGMPNAETYQLILSIQSRVVPNDAGGSVIQTTVEGVGRNPTTSASSDVRCASLGGLEKRLSELVKQRLAGK
ncbi:MAG: hypothetical protein ACK6DP_04295 [Gemmatimonas sp.]|jgi:hypothetical protein|uniref:hypothetical protein n=1 Tax=Gemmatimonas sp. TaxID=1962908 RepID=UPI00391EFC70|nr:hypothetical protein [Gemmatimonadota bacterium]